MIMSETRTAGEIEDILSSIRRLVSEDLHPTPRPQIVSRMVVADRLILTPALRVVSSRPASAETPAAATAAEPAPEPVVSPAAAAPEPEAPLPRLHLGAAQKAEPSRATVVDALAQAVDQQALDWESETGDPGPDADSLDWSSFTFARRAGREEWPGQPANIEAPPPAPTRPEPWAQPDPDAVAAEDQPALKQPRQPAAEQHAAAASRAWADSAEAEALADLAPAEESVTPAQDQVDDIFSEDVLRELVRDLIREQLQGDLGERITRNIRKLVKAEIARALAVQSLE